MFKPVRLHSTFIISAFYLLFQLEQVYTLSESEKSCSFYTNQGSCCIFPFVYRNRTYTECTSTPEDSEIWRNQWRYPWCKLSSGKFQCIRAENRCGGQRTLPAGVISSSNFPRGYLNNSECIWTIRVSQANQITLNFTHLNLSVDQSCESAYVEVYDGSNTTYPLLEKVCGSEMPSPIRSSGNTMMVVFRSTTSEIQQGKGFRAYYDTGDCKVRTYGGNGNGSCCVFPFMYKGETYNSCITKDAEKEGINPDKWCSVTPNYDQDKKRGLCILEDFPCGPGKFECLNNHWWKQCIDISFKCNGLTDCADRSDEESCPPKVNPYKCDILHIITPSKSNQTKTKNLAWKLGRKCGYKERCLSINVTHDKSPCEISTWNKCRNGRCVPPEWVCDGKDDCGDKSDEMQSQCLYKESLSSDACSWTSDCKTWEKQFGEGPLKSKTIATCSSMNITVIPTYLPCSITDIYIFNQKISRLAPSSFSRYLELRKITLVGNDIQDIRPFTFSKLKKLESLDLQNNQLRVILSNTFHGLGSLKELLLRKNELVEIRKNAFLGLSSIKNLNLSDMNLKTIGPGAFSGMHSLEQLSLRNNKNLVRLPKDIFKPLRHLRFLEADRFEFCCMAELSGINCSAPKDLFSSCGDLMANPTLGISIWILGSIALLGNGFVLIWRLKTKSESKVHSLLLLNLAISDFIMGLYLVLIGSVDSYYRGHYFVFSEEWKRSSLCQFCGFLSTLSSEASVFILTIMTADRYVAISHPLRNISLKLSGAYKALALIWTTAFLLAIIPLTGINYFHDFYARSGVCLPLHLTADKPAGWEYSVFVFLVLNFVSFIGIFILYLLMFIKIKQTNTILTGTRQKTATAAIGSRMVFIVLTDFVCWIPIIIIGIASLSGLEASPAVYAWVAVFVLPLNSALNPILYTLSTTNFRRNINATVRKNSQKLQGITFLTTTPENQTVTMVRGKYSLTGNRGKPSHEDVPVANGKRITLKRTKRCNGCLTPILVPEGTAYKDTAV